MNKNKDKFNEMTNLTIGQLFHKIIDSEEQHKKDVENSGKLWAISDIRIDVLKVAFEMEEILKENDYKKGYNNIDMIYLFHKLIEELNEMFEPYKISLINNYYGMLNNDKFESEEDYEEKFLNNEQYNLFNPKEIIDIMNILMMFYINSIRVK